MQYSAKYNVCVYESDADRIIAMVPTARALPNGQVAVPCGLCEMQAMRRLGYPVVSPIESHYDWPCDGITVRGPFKQQRQMAAFLTVHRRAFNLSSMRTGKTLAALWAADYLMSMGEAKKCLILSPLSTIYRVWDDDIFRHFMGRRKAVVIYGSREERLRRMTEKADFYIINHDGLGIGTHKTPRGTQLGELASHIKHNADINLVIVDEGSVYKDPTTTRYKILKHVTAEKLYYWHMSGTPTPNSPEDAWGQRKLVDPAWGESRHVFKDRVMAKVTQFKWIPRAQSAQIVADTLQPAIRFELRECMDMPELTHSYRDVGLSAAQEKALAELKKTLRLELASGTITAVNEASLRLKYIQIACGAIYGDGHEVHPVDAAPRLAVVKELIAESEGKILVFAPLTSVVNLLNRELSKTVAVEMITGSVSAGKRAKVFQAFQESAEPRVIVADPRTLSHGLTLTAANTIIWYAPCDHPEPYTQANARITGSSQKLPMAIYKLAATQVEREAYRRLDSKESLQGLVLDIIKEERTHD